MKKTNQIAEPKVPTRFENFSSSRTGFQKLSRNLIWLFAASIIFLTAGCSSGSGYLTVEAISSKSDLIPCEYAVSIVAEGEQFWAQCNEDPTSTLYDWAIHGNKNGSNSNALCQANFDFTGMQLVGPNWYIQNVGPTSLPIDKLEKLQSLFGGELKTPSEICGNG
jgi:hypothetical protein